MTDKKFIDGVWGNSAAEAENKMKVLIKERYSGYNVNSIEVVHNDHCDIMAYEAIASISSFNGQLYPLYLRCEGTCSGLIDLKIFTSQKDREIFKSHIEKEYKDEITAFIPTNEYGNEIKAFLVDNIETEIAKFDGK